MFRSFISFLAISWICAAVTLPATSRPGLVEPFGRFRLPTGGRPAAVFSRNEAGGVFRSRLNDLVLVIGDHDRNRGARRNSADLALNSFTKAMMFRPR